MGEARQVLDMITEAILAGDRDGIARLYAEDAVADTPDEGRLVGRDAVADYLAGFARAFPAIEWEPISQLETGDTAIDEGYIIGVNTGPLATPEGELPATGRAIRLRECDLLTVRDGLAVSHRFHYDQLDMLTQLGLMGAETIVLPDQRAAAQTEPAPAR
jgi:ketosteroid isomerase-like protein